MYKIYNVLTFIYNYICVSRTMFANISKFFNSLCCCSKKQNVDLIVIRKSSTRKKSNKLKVGISISNGDSNGDSNAFDSRNITYLDNIDYKDTIPFIPPISFCKVIKVYDGDTITVCSKLPFEGSPVYRFRVRLASIDSPEIRGGTKHETELAIISRDALHNLIYGKIIELRGNKIEKYGRVLADLYIGNLHINKWLIDNNYAVPYDGGKKNRPDDWNE
jgi:micrococcal nuclease